MLNIPDDEEDDDAGVEDVVLVPPPQVDPLEDLLHLLHHVRGEVEGL